VHSRIHLDVHRCARAAPASCVSQKRQVAFVVHDRRCPESEGSPRFFRVLHPAEDEDRKRHCGLPQFRSLAHPGDGKAFAAGARQRSCHACGSVSVGIGFHYGDHAAVSGKAPCKGVVRHKSAEIDARDRRPGKLHRRVYNPSKIGPKSGRGV
jgi:hypothetical protein